MTYLNRSGLAGNDLIDPKTNLPAAIESKMPPVLIEMFVLSEAVNAFRSSAGQSQPPLCRRVHWILPPALSECHTQPVMEQPGASSPKSPWLLSSGSYEVRQGQTPAGSVADSISHVSLRFFGIRLE